MTYLIYSNIVPDVSDAIDMYVGAGWGTHEQHNKNIYTEAFNNSSFITAYLESELIGLVRFLTDNHQTTYVIEFLVKPELQKTRVGISLMQELLKNYGHTSIYVDATEQSIGFFAKCGLKKHSLTGMSIRYKA